MRGPGSNAVLAFIHTPAGKLKELIDEGRHFGCIARFTDTGKEASVLISPFLSKRFGGIVVFDLLVTDFIPNSELARNTGFSLHEGKTRICTGKLLLQEPKAVQDPPSLCKAWSLDGEMGRVIKKRDAYLIEVKPEHRPGRGQYWRVDGAGYTDTLSEAGVFTDDDESYNNVHDNPDSRSVVVKLPQMPIEAMLAAGFVKL